MLTLIVIVYFACVAGCALVYGVYTGTRKSTENRIRMLIRGAGVVRCFVCAFGVFVVYIFATLLYFDKRYRSSGHGMYKRVLTFTIYKINDINTNWPPVILPITVCVSLAVCCVYTWRRRIDSSFCLSKYTTQPRTACQLMIWWNSTESKRLN